MLVQQSESPLLHLSLIQEMHAAMKDAGFKQTHLLHFPQPIYPSGWWSASIACKKKGKLAERLDARALKALRTEYYNAETHRGAFAVPGFVRSALKA
jgi:spermidine synthase